MTITTTTIHQLTDTSVALLETAPTSYGVVTLPARFDVHQIDAVIAEIDANSTTGDLMIVASFVEMIDHDAIEATTAKLAELNLRGVTVEIISPSVALRVTLDLAKSVLVQPVTAPTAVRDLPLPLAA